jgi:hypothetical protein
MLKHRAMKVYSGSGSIAPRILDLDTRRRWMVSFTWAPAALPPGKEPQSRSGRGSEEKNSQPLPGIEPYNPDNSDRPVRSPALYRLSYFYFMLRNCFLHEHQTENYEIGISYASLNSLEILISIKCL